MDERSNVRRVPAKPISVADAMGLLAHGEAYPEIKPEREAQRKMQQRKSKFQATVGFIAAVSFVAWVIILGWAAVAWVVISLAEWRAS